MITDGRLLAYSDKGEELLEIRTNRNGAAAPTSLLGHRHLRIAEATASTGAVERHYTVKELGALWRLSASTVSRIFRHEQRVN